ncbi:MAG TPA: Maf family protein [Micromonosporaceae bacterium]
MRRLVLASASPARRKLLQAAGIDPQVVVSGIDESTTAATSAEELCLLLARRKARAVAELLRTDLTAGSLVLGCDSVLAFDGEVLGKPADAADAVARWRRMRGRSGVLHTGHCLIEVGGPGGTDREEAAVASTTVHFAPLDETEIQDYVATGEPLQVAGAFTIDGLGGPFVERIEGDHGTVVGLSLPLLRRMLADLGVRMSELWSVREPKVD